MRSVWQRRQRSVWKIKLSVNAEVNRTCSKRDKEFLKPKRGGDGFCRDMLPVKAWNDVKVPYIINMPLHGC